MMKRYSIAIVSILVIVTLLSACSTSTPTPTIEPLQITPSSTPNPTGTPIPTIAPSPTFAPSPTIISAVTSEPLNTPIPTSLDPCQLITSQEASTLAGVSYGPGAEETFSGNGKSCVYGSQNTNIFAVEVVQASDEATAQAAQTQFLADLESKLPSLSSEGFKVTQLPNFADGAVTGQASFGAGGITASGSAFGFRKGTIFVGFSDIVIGGTAPSSEAMQSQATTVLGRLP